MHNGVRAELRPDARRVRFERPRAIGDRRQWLVIDLDRFRGVARHRRRLRDHDGQAFAHEAGLTARQNLARRLVHGRAIAVLVGGVVQ